MFPEDNFNITKLDNIISYLLEVFNKTKKIITEKRFYNHLKYELFKKLDNWKKNSNQLKENRRLLHYSNKDST